MALQCRVVLNENNEIDYVKTEDGQRSQLFDGLAETLGGDKNSALGFYALTESEDFKTAQKAKKTESPVYSIAKIYKDRLTKEKQNNPSQYWSVDIPSDEVIKDAARNGRIVDVNGGMGIVTEDGNMIGMFKYDKNAKNTAQAVQEARIQKGGVKLDNYDGYLTKLYQKNGFRVAARLPFNKEFAPEDWSEEVSGTPDVVFMVYDPQNKLKIEEKTFEDYDEASAYRDSFVKKLTNSQDEQKTITNFSKQAGDRTRWDSSRGNQTLEGAPTIQGATGADPELTSIAEQYARDKGIDYKRQSKYVEVDTDLAKRIAQAYEEMEHTPQDPKVKEAYENLIRQTTEQYQYLVDAGYKFYFFNETNDPYEGNPWNAMRDLRNNKVMAVFETEAGFGSGITDLDVSDNPLLADTGIKWGAGSLYGKPKKVLANDLFRAVHDAFGHGLEGSGFRARGEENAWQSHVKLFTGSAIAALTSETRGQNSWLNYGKFGDKNRTAKIEDTVFADQKVGLMPEWTWTEGVEKLNFVSGGAAFAKFFDKIVNTKDGGAKFKNVKDVLNKSVDGFEKELAAYLKYGKNFQKHIMASIPGFVDARIRVLKGMTSAASILGAGGKEVNMLDITSSEGYFTKAFAQLAQDKGINVKADALDAGVAFQRDFNEAPQVPGVKFLLQAWGESFVDPASGKTIPLFKPKKKYGVVFEGMGFQFFTPTRDKEIAEVKSLMDDGGLFVTMEKFKNKDYERREILKDQFKEQFFTKEEMAEKAKTVLKKSDDASVGMMDYQFDRLEYEKVLVNNFKYVTQFYSSGNFAGYLASDNLEVISAALRDTGDTTTKFNEEITPRIVQGEAKKEKVKEPSVEDVIQYANAIEEELTPEQTIDLQDVIMSLGVDNSKEAEKKLKEALETKGFIRFNKKQMLNSGAFNKYEVKQILNSKEKQDQVEQSYRALKNSPTIEVEYPKDSVNKESKINSFGKQSVINPLLPIENEGVEVKTVTKEGALENKTTGTDTEVILNNTYIGEENIKLSENLFFITKTFSPAVWENKKDAIFKVVKQIKEYAKDSGIDLKNIEEKVYTKSREEIINFFESLEDFLQKGDATEFASLYNEMFELNTPVKESIRTDNKFDVYMDEDVSEYEAFTKHNLVKKSPTVYRKIKGDLSLDEAYSIISQNENISEEQLRKEVKENPLEVSDYEVDVEELEKMQLYKRYFNFPKNIPSIKITNQKKSFIRKANKWLLKSGNPYYKITKNGLELVSQDEITRSRAELTLPEYLKQEEKEEVIVEDLNKERRLEALTNPSSVQKVKGEFLYLEPEVVAIKNEVESMVRTPRGIFEYMYGQGNAGFYGKVTSEERPLSNMNYKQYTYLENSPELFQKAKNYYSKAELDEINRDNFECS